jgi:uncharacterized membrane protein/predicted DsbA family dithiol-disulfide isomerase
MAIRHRLFIIRIASLAALACCVALLTTYLRAGSLVCSYEFDCDDVLSSPFSNIAGVPLPVFGLLGFAAILASSFSVRPWSALLLRILAPLAAIVGAMLIMIQVFVLNSICPYCMVVDSCAIIVGLASLGWRPDNSAMVSRPVLFGWLAAMLASLGLGTALGTMGNTKRPFLNTAMPPQIRTYWVPGKVNIVEITDFQCPHCRRMHLILSEFLKEQGDNIHLTVVAAPMEKHPQAKDAARAYLCAQEQNKGEEMADKLFEETDLRPAACEKYAASLGLSREQFRACVQSPQTDAKLDADKDWLSKASSEGLPCLWIQDQRLWGVQQSRDLAIAVATAEQRLRTGKRY